MTREEAIVQVEHVTWNTLRSAEISGPKAHAAGLVASLEALGLLNFDTPDDPVLEIVTKALLKLTPKLSPTVAHLDASFVLREIERGGFKIARA